MPGPEFASYKGTGSWARDNFNYNSTARVGDFVTMAGQGGWPQDWTPASGERGFPTDPAAELTQAYHMCDVALKNAGVARGLGAAYKVRVYSTLDVNDPIILDAIVKAQPEQKPSLTVIGVRQLAAPNMRFEVEVEAYDPKA